MLNFFGNGQQEQKFYIILWSISLKYNGKEK